MSALESGYLYTMDRQGVDEFLSTSEGLLSVIEQLRGGAKQRWTTEIIRTYAQALTRFGEGVYRSYQIPKGMTVCRVRALNPDEPWFSSAAELGSPDEFWTKESGRCHAPGAPVCYCSLYEDTALAEVDAQTGRRYAVATFELLDDLIVLPVGEFDFYRRTGQTYLGSAIPGITQHFKDIRESRRDARLLEIVDAFLAEEFLMRASTESDYRLTATFSEILFGLLFNTPVDAIFYPSVAFRAGYNFAISREAEKRKLRLVERETRLVKVNQALGYGIFDTKDVALLRAVSGEGQLDWEPVEMKEPPDGIVEVGQG
jgi:hypothetical protein